MSTEQELMKLVADYGKECICAGIADLNANDAVKQRMAEDVRKSHEALTARLRALLAELDAAREDAARYKFLKEGDWRDNEKLEPIIRLQLNLRWDEAIDAARKGEA